MAESRAKFIKTSTPHEVALLKRIEEGKERPNFSVCFGVRTDKIDRKKFNRNRFSDIVWAFPQRSDLNTITPKQGQDLLHKIFQSISEWQMSKWSTRFHLTIAEECSGFHSEKVSQFGNIYSYYFDFVIIRNYKSL